MPTIPTNRMERELRKAYLQWVAALPKHENDVQDYIGVFERKSRSIITKMGGQVASLGALTGFPVPKTLELSPTAGVVYNEMRQAAISASITAGLNSREAARAMLTAGLGKNYKRLERLARTETTNAYWRNAWSSVADLPLIVMVWGAEESKRTCEYCLSRDGLVIEDGNIRDHPNGRCTPIPTLRSQVKYKGTLQPDGSVTMDPRWSEQKVAGAKPQASAGPTTATQRDPLSGKSNPAAPSVAQPTDKAAAASPATARGMQVQDQPAVSVTTFGSSVDAKTLKARIKEGDWRFIDDRDKRAVTLLQNDYRSEKAIKKAAANLRNGKPAMDGVGVPSAWAKPYTQFVTDANAKYTVADVRSAIEDAAHWLNEQQAVTPRTLYKGLDVPKDKIAKLFKEGADFNTDYSSFTTNESIARGYGGWGSKQVIVRAKNTQAIKVEGNPTADHWKTTKEHLVTGQGKVVKVVDDGRTVWVDVEFE